MDFEQFDKHNYYAKSTHVQSIKPTEAWIYMYIHVHTGNATIVCAQYTL